MAKHVVYMYAYAVGDDKYSIKPEAGESYSLSKYNTSLGIFSSASDAAKAASDDSAETGGYPDDVVEGLLNLDQWDRGVFMTIDVRPAP
jgi:hypothetical protein